MDQQDLQLLATKKHELLHAAQEARKLSYSPYSKFRVGAALLTKWGEIILGANYENASYGGTVCAERTALAKALIRSDALDVPETGSGRKVSRGDIIGVAVASDLEGSCSPCGICRQVIREHCSLNARILMVGCNWSKATAQQPSPAAVTDQGGKELNEPNVEVVTLDYLLPMSFGPEDLDKPRQSS
ncbi:cytidine deaminase [Moesziomyces antarcticus T-34]|jgi:cytidine deaminase|uniref:Cytidine deaminase n=1 Tax=Pseudozyma antarctica (strain T-34) TaxID=1151754 RepID=M9M095_PSEA3|nr:cytidine deaminase [Moesziomyces antarcticus T-34]